MQYYGVQCSSVVENIVQYSAIECSRIECSRVQCGVVKQSAGTTIVQSVVEYNALCRRVQYCRVQQSVVEWSIVQCSIVQYSKVQYWVVQRGTALQRYREVQCFTALHSSSIEKHNASLHCTAAVLYSRAVPRECCAISMIGEGTEDGHLIHLMQGKDGGTGAEVQTENLRLPRVGLAFYNS